MISSIHKEYGKRNNGNEVGKVHDRWTGKHPHATYIFCYPVHEITSAMSFIECAIQFLVVLVYFIFLIKLNVATHHDDRLAHQEKKDPS